MKIFVTGSSGLIGSALVAFLTAHGHTVTRLVRRSPRPGAEEIFWNPEAGSIDASSLEGFEAAVHMAAESLAAIRWTPAKKKRILESRIRGTELLARTLATLGRPPQVMISASAVGYYGDRGAEELREDSSAGSGFLSDVCRHWEQAASVVADRGIRLVLLRQGLVLSAAGGALPRMLPPFRLGIGGRLGSGTQYMGWLALDDLLEIVMFVLLHHELSGPINAVAPEPVTNRDFTRALGHALGRPAFLTIPAIAVQMMFGEMGKQLLLASTRAVPERLAQAGFQFRFPDLETALRHVLAS